MSEPAQLAKTAREHLAAALNALQSNAHVPDELMDIAEPIADAMGILHKIERSNGATLDGREDALNHVRGSLDRLQKISVHHPAIDVVMESVASSLSKVHGLVRYTPPAAGPVAQAGGARSRGDSVRPPAPSTAAYAAPAAAPAAPAASTARHAAPPQPAPQPSFAAPIPAAQAAPYAPVPAAVPAPVPAGFGATMPIQPSPFGAQGAFPASGSAQPAAAFGSTAPLPQQPAAAAPHQYPPPPAQPQYAPPAAQQQYAQPQQAQASQQYAQPQQAQGSQQYAQPQPQQASQQYAQPQQAQPQQYAPQPAPQPQAQDHLPATAAAGAPAGAAYRAPQKGASNFDVELGTHSNSNFYKGLGGNDVIEHGGIFVATYKIPKIGAPVQLRVLLPGDLEFQANAVVQWTREGGVSGDSAEPGFGARFTHITPDGRQLVYRYTRNREPIFYDDL
jgi:hypothetical protein